MRGWMWAVVLVTGFAVGPAAVAADPSFAGTVRPFLDTYCTSCHQGTGAKAGLKLDGPPPNFADSKTVSVWADLLDRVESREMPPAKADQPEPAERAAVVRWVEQQLVAADKARRTARGGRTAARRLNRDEYENTIRDLLGIDLDLKHQLPEDGSPATFDTIGAGLSVSAVHLERYLEAASLAAEAAFPDRPRPQSKSWNVTLRPTRLRQPPESDYRLKIGVRELPDGTFVLFNSANRHLIAEQFQAPEEGSYRVRVHTSAFQSGGKPLTLALYAGSFDLRNYTARLVGHFDVPPDTPRVIEFTERLAVKGTVKASAYGLGNRDLAFNADYAGPGVAVHSIDIEGPLTDDWPPRAQRDLLGRKDPRQLTAADARAALVKFLPAAFRRPVGPEVIEFYTDLVKARISAGTPFLAAFRAAVRAALCSPDFLFLRVRGPNLDGHELAARLSYFLWSSCPDDALTAAAARGDLNAPAGLRTQVERMLKDPKAARFTENFCGQWLGLRQIEATTPDQKLYPEYDDLLLDSMTRETHLFFNELLGKNLGVRNLVDSDWAVLNGRLARHYAVPGADGLEFRRVPLPPGSHRGGVLTQASVLKVTANGTTTSPVVRGNWVLKTLLSRPVKGPPPEVPAIEPDVRGTTSIRDQLAKHRASVACAGCHNRIDPLGLALESYDVIGGYRTFYRATATTGKGQPFRVVVDGRPHGMRKGPGVDPSGTLPTGEAFADLDGLKAFLLRDERQLAVNMAEKLTAYATGAEPEFADRPTVRAVVDRAKAGGYGLRTLVHEIVQSDTFRTR